MSDIQELIHKTSMDCIEKGQRMERERIIKLLVWETRSPKLAEMFQDLEHGEIRHEMVINYLLSEIKGNSHDS